MVTPDTEVIVGFHIEGFLGLAVKENPAALDLLDYAELRGITPAEVRELQREASVTGRRTVAKFRGTPVPGVPEERMQAVAAFVDAEHSRWSLLFVPQVH